MLSKTEVIEKPNSNEVSKKRTEFGSMKAEKENMLTSKKTLGFYIFGLQGLVWYIGTYIYDTHTERGGGGSSNLSYVCGFF